METAVECKGLPFERKLVSSTAVYRILAKMIPFPHLGC